MDNPLSDIKDTVQNSANGAADSVSKAADGATEQLAQAADGVTDLAGNLDTIIENGINHAEQQIDGFIKGLDNFLGKF